MYLTPKQPRKRIFLEWETWAALLLAGLGGGLGSYFGQGVFGHASLFAATGGIIGGYVLHVVIKYVEHRHHSASA